MPICIFSDMQFRVLLFCLFLTETFSTPILQIVKFYFRYKYIYLGTYVIKYYNKMHQWIIIYLFIYFMIHNQFIAFIQLDIEWNVICSKLFIYWRQYLRYFLTFGRRRFNKYESWISRWFSENREGNRCCWLRFSLLASKLSHTEGGS